MGKMQQQQRNGKVKNYSTEKGYGFIVPDDGSEDVFFLGSEVDHISRIKRNDRVCYRIRESKKHKGKKEAWDIKQLSDMSSSSVSKECFFSHSTINQLFGYEGAELEKPINLKKWYLKPSFFSDLKSDTPIIIVAGNKGVGKTALFKTLIEENKLENCIPILIKPDEIEDLSYTNSNFLQMVRNWKLGMYTKITHELISFSGKCLAAPIKNQKLQKFSSALIEYLSSVLKKKSNEITDKNFNVNSDQFANMINQDFFSDKTIYVYLDDLDRGWTISNNVTQSLNAMLNALMDIASNNFNIRFRVSITSVVYYNIRSFNHTSDKFNGDVVWIQWTKKDIEKMLAMRIEKFFNPDGENDDGNNLTEDRMNELFDKIFEHSYLGTGKWDNVPFKQVIVSVVRDRPRDLVQLCKLAAKEAQKNRHDKIQTEDLANILNQYSLNKFQEAVLEYKMEFPEIERLMRSFVPDEEEIHSKGNPFLYSRNQLLDKLDRITKDGEYMINGKRATPAELATVLYKIGFINARRDRGNHIERVVYDLNRYIFNEFTDNGYSYEVEPAYRFAVIPPMFREIPKYYFGPEFEKVKSIKSL